MSDIKVMDAAVSPTKHIISFTRRAMSVGKSLTTGTLIVFMTGTMSVLDKALRATTWSIDKLSAIDRRRCPEHKSKSDTYKVIYQVLRPISIFGGVYSVDVLRFTGVDYHKVGKNNSVVAVRIRGSISAITSIVSEGRTAYNKSLLGVVSRFSENPTGQSVSLQSEGKECWIIIFKKQIPPISKEIPESPASRTIESISESAEGASDNKED